MHIESAEKARDIWTKLAAMYADTGVSRRITLLRRLISARLEDFNGMELYVNYIIDTAHKLNASGLKIGDDWVGSLLLAGLPTRFQPMIMGIEHSGIEITSDNIKTKLLDDDSDMAENSGGNAFAVNKKYKNFKKKELKCFECLEPGHKRSQCPRLKSSSKSKYEHSRKSNGGSGKNVHAFSAIFLTGNFNKNDWYIDSGASSHLTVHIDWLANRRQVENASITVANNTNLPVECSGEVEMRSSVEGETKNIVVHDVMCVPQLTTNLLSVSQLVRRGNTVIFDESGCRIFNQHNEVIAIGELYNNMFRLKIQHIDLCMQTSLNSASVWHRRLGHLSDSVLTKMNTAVSGLKIDGKIDNKFNCVSCCEGKQIRNSFGSNGSRAKSTLEIIHTDLCGPSKIPTIGGARYFLLFVDDFSRMVFVYFLKKKDEAFSCFVDFKSQAENQLNKKIKILRSDNGGEFCNRIFDDFLKKNGIIHQTTNPHTPEQNGLCERMNRSVVEKARCMLFDADLDTKFWGEATNTAVYLINRTVCAGLVDKTPYEIWYGTKPDISQLKVFGCDAMMHVPKAQRTKWSKKSKRMIFVGYGETTKGYRLIDPVTLKLVYSRDVVFMERISNIVDLPVDLPVEANSETTFTEISESSGDSNLNENVNNNNNILSNIHQQNANSVEESTSSPNLNETDNMYDAIENSNASDESDATITNDFSDASSIMSAYDTDSDFDPEMTVLPSLPVTPRRSARERKQRVIDGAVSFLCVMDTVYDPTTVKEALDCPNAVDWEKAMKCEYDSLIENNTWSLCNLPSGKKSDQLQMGF